MSSLSLINNVTWEESTTILNVLYVKEHSSQWTAIVNMGIGINEFYPYISFPNEIRVSVKSPQITVTPDSRVISTGNGNDYRNLISTVNMKDYNDDYGTYYYDDGFATARGIKRDKFISFDKQWINKDNYGLDYRQYYGERGSKYAYVQYLGYDGEDLCDKITAGNLTDKLISKITVKGRNNKIITTDTCYYDRYCN